MPPRRAARRSFGEGISLASVASGCARHSGERIPRHPDVAAHVAAQVSSGQRTIPAADLAVFISHLAWPGHSCGSETGLGNGVPYSANAC